MLCWISRVKGRYQRQQQVWVDTVTVLRRCTLLGIVLSIMRYHNLSGTVWRISGTDDSRVYVFQCVSRHKFLC